MAKASKKPAAATDSSLNYFQDDGGASRAVLLLLNMQAERSELDASIRGVIAHLAGLHGLDRVYPDVFPDVGEPHKLIAQSGLVHIG